MVRAVAARIRIWIWQLVTYGFLHGGIAHIFFNMLGLYMFGSDIERLFGSRYFLFYYFACLVAAALTQLVFTAIAGGPPVRPWALPVAYTDCCWPSGCISRGAWSC